MRVSTETRRLRTLLLVALGQDELGRRIKRAREDAGMTQPELAAAVGWAHPQSVSKAERGETEVPMPRLRRIADATGKPLGFFVRENETLEPATPPDFLDRLDRMEAQLEGLVAAVEELVRRQRQSNG